MQNDKNDFPQSKGGLDSPGGQAGVKKGDENPEIQKEMIKREAPQPGGEENAVGVKKGKESSEEHNSIGASPSQGES